LELPYGEPVELIMEILRHGPDVEVVGPAALREMVRKRLQQTLQLY
jgi:predicted DNA-binding transcriptional regulator YafY